MPFPMKIQPIDVDALSAREPVRTDSTKLVLKSRLRRLFDRPFPSVLRISSAEKPIVGGAAEYSSKDGGGTEFEPSSVCLDKMVQNFLEDSSNEKPSAVATAAVKCGRNRCNCFNANGNDSSDDEFDVLGGFGEFVISGSSGGDASDVLKSLIPCVSVAERNFLADVAKIVEKSNKVHKRKDDVRKIVIDGLSSLGHDSSLCKSKWEKSSSFPAGEYEFIDVIVEGERFLIDIDFRSEFEIARPTGTYKAILQLLPYIFVGKSDRLGQIVSIVSEAAKQSLNKKGMHIPPWRKAEYMRAKWLSPTTRIAKPLPISNDDTSEIESQTIEVPIKSEQTKTENVLGEFALIFGDSPQTPTHEASAGGSEISSEVIVSSEDEKAVETVQPWKPPAIKPKSVERGAKIVTGLASLLKEKA